MIEVLLVLYVAGVGLSLVAWWRGALLDTGVALIWLVPDTRKERTLSS